MTEPEVEPRNLRAKEKKWDWLNWRRRFHHGSSGLSDNAGGHRNLLGCQAGILAKSLTSGGDHGAPPSKSGTFSFL